MCVCVCVCVCFQVSQPHLPFGVGLSPYNAMMAGQLRSASRSSYGQLIQTKICVDPAYSDSGQPGVTGHCETATKRDATEAIPADVHFLRFCLSGSLGLAIAAGCADASADVQVTKRPRSSSRRHPLHGRSHSRPSRHTQRRFARKAHPTRKTRVTSNSNMIH